MIYLKRFIASILFIAGLVGLLLAASAVVVPNTKVTDFGAKDLEANGILCEKDNTIDVLFLGDSETYCAFSPMEIWKDTGYTSYVSGTSGQTLDYTYTLLQRTTAKQSPKIMVLETNTVFRITDNYRIIKTWLGTNFSIFTSHDSWKDLNLKDLFSPSGEAVSDDNKGYVFNTVKKPAELIDFSIPNGDKEFIPENNIKLLKEIKEHCDKNGIKLVFVSAPSTVNWTHKRHNAMIDLAKELDCEYIDMNMENDIIKIDFNNDTRDKGDHMNYFGAVKVSKYMADYFEKTDLLADRRQNPDYSHWHEAFERYMNKINKSGI